MGGRKDTLKKEIPVFGKDGKYLENRIMTLSDLQAIKNIASTKQALYTEDR